MVLRPFVPDFGTIKSALHGEVALPSVLVIDMHEVQVPDARLTSGP